MGVVQSAGPGGSERFALTHIYTQMPTMEPTQAPTPLPQPNPQQPLQIVGYQRVALTERALPSKYYSARRLVENDVVFDEEGADTAGEGVHRRLVSAADNTESCYAGAGKRSKRKDMN